MKVKYEITEVADDLDICLLWKDGELIGEFSLSIIRELAKTHKIKIKGLSEARVENWR